MAPISLSPLNATLLSMGGILLIGCIDYLTGTEIRVLPLYFAPLALAARYVGRTASVLLALMTTAVWLAAVYFGDRGYSRDWIWVVNAFTQGSAFVLVAVLLSHTYKLLHRERRVSSVDELTGLYNRRAFCDQAEALRQLCHRERRPVTLAYIDLDNFKNANDTFGHAYGDDLLRVVAKLLRSRLRASDLVARMGGDEFAVLLPGTGENAARRVLDEVRRDLSRQAQLATCGVSASVGALAYAAPPVDLETMIQAADRLMYGVKRDGKNRVVVEAG